MGAGYGPEQESRGNFSACKTSFDGESMNKRRFILPYIGPEQLVFQLVLDCPGWFAIALRQEEQAGTNLSENVVWPQFILAPERDSSLF
jgi:hypothetical protein